MTRLRRSVAAYLTGLLLLVALPVGYLLLVPESLDRKLGIALRSAAFRLREMPVERAAALVDEGAEEEAELVLEKYLDARRGVGGLTYESDSVCEALLLLSDLYERQKRRNRCLASRRRLVELRPHDFYYAYLLARSHETLGSTQEALAEYLRAFRLEPAYPDLQEAYFSLLGELAMSQPLVEAYEFSQRMKRRNPPRIVVRYSPPPSKPERRALRVLGMPLMAPDRDSADLFLEDDGTTLQIPLAPAQAVGPPNEGLLLWGQIYKMPDELAWQEVAILDRDGSRHAVAPEGLELERKAHSLQYDYSILLPSYPEGSGTVVVTFERTRVFLDAEVRRAVAQAYRDQGRAVPARLVEEVGR
jgi:tetratricopeptide (TPR) repeat protein